MKGRTSGCIGVILVTLYSWQLGGANLLSDTICLVSFKFGLKDGCGQLGLFSRKKQIIDVIPDLLIQNVALLLQSYVLSMIRDYFLL